MENYTINLITDVNRQEPRERNKFEDVYFNIAKPNNEDGEIEIAAKDSLNFHTDLDAEDGEIKFTTIEPNENELGSYFSLDAGGNLYGRDYVNIESDGTIYIGDEGNCTSIEIGQTGTEQDINIGSKNVNIYGDDTINIISDNTINIDAEAEMYLKTRYLDIESEGSIYAEVYTAAIQASETIMLQAADGIIITDGEDSVPITTDSEGLVINNEYSPRVCRIVGTLTEGQKTAAQVRAYLTDKTTDLNSLQRLFGGGYSAIIVNGETLPFMGTNGSAISGTHEAVFGYCWFDNNGALNVKNVWRFTHNGSTYNLIHEKV